MVQRCEVVLESLLSLALKDEDCAAVLFSPKEMNKYLSSFDSYELEKLAECEGRGELKLRMGLFKIGQFRKRAQNFAKVTITDTGSKSSKVTSPSAIVVK